MIAGPVLVGALQLTSRLVCEPAVALTVGAAGAPGALAAAVVNGTAAELSP